MNKNIKGIQWFALGLVLIGIQIEVRTHNQLSYGLIITGIVIMVITLIIKYLK